MVPHAVFNLYGRKRDSETDGVLLALHRRIYFVQQYATSVLWRCVVVRSAAASRYHLFAGAWLQTRNYYVSGGDILDCSRKYKLMNACFLDHSPLHKVRVRLHSTRNVRVRGPMA